jgi:hypothetical protein
LLGNSNNSPSATPSISLPIGYYLLVLRGIITPMISDFNNPTINGQSSARPNSYNVTCYATNNNVLNLYNNNDGNISSSNVILNTSYPPSGSTITSIVNTTDPNVFTNTESLDSINRVDYYRALPVADNSSTNYNGYVTPQAVYRNGTTNGTDSRNPPSNSYYSSYSFSFYSYFRVVNASTSIDLNYTISNASGNQLSFTFTGNNVNNTNRILLDNFQLAVYAIPS